MADGTSAPAPHHTLSVVGRTHGLSLNFQADLTEPWTVFFGPSGCGKTTLLRAMAGLTPELSVEFTRNARAQPGGTDTCQLHRLAPESRGLAYAPQQAVLFPHLSVRENISFAAAVRKMGNRVDAGVEDAMRLLELESLADRKPDTLSGGERQRVSLARALAVPSPGLAVLDEPFAGVDRSLRDTLLPRVQAAFAKRRVPVISVTHDVDEAVLLGAEVIRLRDGAVAEQGPVAAVLASEISRTIRILMGAGPV